MITQAAVSEAMARSDQAESGSEDTKKHYLMTTNRL